MTSPAAAHLRASIAALPEHLAVGPTWTATDGAVIECGPTGYLSIDGETIEQAAADHIALTASPDVVALWADLLDAIPREGRISLWEHEVDDIQAARDALEAAILRSAT